MNTKALRQKILDLAIHGKLVPQDLNDEPASVLLERIRDEKERLIKEGKIKRPKKTKTTSDKPHYENLLPEGWKWCKLEDIALIGTGATPMTKCKDYYYKGEIAWINSSSTNAPYIDKASNFITKKAISETNCVIYPKGTLILAMYGEGKTRGQISELLIEAATNQACAAICPFYKETKEYIKIFFESNYWHLRTLAEGGTQPNLNLGKISSYDIPFPPIEEQKRIVEEVKHWITIIDVIEQRKSDLRETIKQAKSKILDLAIHGKLVPQDPTDESARELLKRIGPKAEITSDNGHYQKLPEGWVITSISEMCENINGLWKGKKEPFVKVGVIRNANFTKDFKLDYSKIEYIDVEERAFKKRHLLNGDLIVEKSGGSDNNPVGRAILYEGKDAIFSFSNFTMVLRIHYKDVLSYKYLYYYIMSKYQKGEMRLMQTQTTGLHNLILDKYLDIPLCLPPYQEQQRIINKIEETFGVLDLIMENL